MVPGVKSSALIAAGIAVMALQTSAFGQSLKSAVLHALNHSSELNELQSARAASKFAHEASNGLSAPQIALNASASVASDFDNSNDEWTASVSATQNILDGGYAKSEQERTRFEEKSASYRYTDQHETVGLQTVQAYLEVQRSRALIRILAAHENRLAALKKKVGARVAAGVAGEVELYDAAAKLDTATLNLLDVKAQLADAIVNFESRVGQKPTTLSTQSPPATRLPKSEAAAASLAISHSPRIMAVRYDALSADAAASGFAAANKPKLDLSLSAGHSDDFLDQVSDSTDLSAQISFRLNLYDGGVAKARESQVRMQADAARHRARTAAREVEREIRLSWNTIHLAGDRKRVLLSQLKNSRNSLRLSIARYDAGITSLTQLLDLNAQVASSEAAWLNADFSHRYNVYRVLAGTGRLLSALQLDQQAGNP